jgi:hypothetical protein
VLASFLSGRATVTIVRTSAPVLYQVQLIAGDITGV